MYLKVCPIYSFNFASTGYLAAKNVAGEMQLIAFVVPVALYSLDP